MRFNSRGSQEAHCDTTVTVPQSSLCMNDARISEGVNMQRFSDRKRSLELSTLVRQENKDEDRLKKLQSQAISKQIERQRQLGRDDPHNIVGLKRIQGATKKPGA